MIEMKILRVAGTVVLACGTILFWYLLEPGRFHWNPLVATQGEDGMYRVIIPHLDNKNAQTFWVTYDLGKRRTITINHSEIQQDIYDFPVLFNLPESAKGGR